MRIRFLLALLTLAGCAGPAALEQSAAKLPIEVVKAEFGLFNALETGRPPFIATPLVPLVVNQAYGWVIVLKTSEKTVRWREEFTLPAAPATWGGPERIGTRSMSDDGRTTITEREVTLHNGAIFNSWSVAPGDPTGTYRMRVTIEDRLVRTFEFRVE